MMFSEEAEVHQILNLQSLDLDFFDFQIAEK